MPCRVKTILGRPCRNPVVANGLCHVHHPDMSGSDYTLSSHAASMSTRLFRVPDNIYLYTYKEWGEEYICSLEKPTRICNSSLQAWSGGDRLGIRTPRLEKWSPRRVLKPRKMIPDFQLWNDKAGHFMSGVVKCIRNPSFPFSGYLSKTQVIIDLDRIITPRRKTVYLSQVLNYLAATENPTPDNPIHLHLLICLSGDGKQPSISNQELVKPRRPLTSIRSRLNPKATGMDLASRRQTTRKNQSISASARRAAYISKLRRLRRK